MAISVDGGRFSDPMIEINTTPLIDVMLVLLIMLIITLPFPTHSVKLDLPPDCRALENGCPILPDMVRNIVSVDASDRITWNGFPLTMQQLRDMLVRSHNLIPEPELILRPEADARHAKVTQILRETKYAGISKFGFDGNEAYSEF